MKKVFDKHETAISIMLIVLYVVINSYCMQNFGLENYRSTIINTVFSAVLIVFIISIGRTSYYGLTRVRYAKECLYFLPLVFVVSVNLWNGVDIAVPATEILFYMLTMCNIGFLEEVIFRGFLFKMMAKDNLKSAIVVSSITFGLGHVVNLLNGADLIPTLAQMSYAIALGYMFVIIFYKTKSLIPCIAAHATINALLIFNVVHNTLSVYIIPIVLIVVPVLYATYINKAIKE